MILRTTEIRKTTKKLLKKYKSIIKKKNTIEVLISKALIDSYIRFLHRICVSK